MSTLTHTLAKEAVAAFLAELDAPARGVLRAAQLERLELLIREAVSAGIHNAAERAENLARELRRDAEPAEIEL
jgi:hypothetical protein